ALGAVLRHRRSSLRILDGIHRPERILLRPHDYQGPGDVSPRRIGNGIRAGCGCHRLHPLGRVLLGELPRLQPRNSRRSYRHPHLLSAWRSLEHSTPWNFVSLFAPVVTPKARDMTTPVLELQRVSKAFGGIQALKQVSFAVQEGQIAALIGPNGAGKTTLVNVITGAQRASAGSIVFRGTNVTRQHPFQAARRGLARTFQIVQPFPRMSVLENVAAGALFARAHVGLSAAMAAAREELEFTGLSAFAD